MGANDPGCSHFRPQGHDLQDSCRVPSKHCYILNIQASGLMVSEEKFSLYFPNMKQGTAFNGHGWQCFVVSDVQLFFA